MTASAADERRQCKTLLAVLILNGLLFVAEIRDIGLVTLEKVEVARYGGRHVISA